jgi:hypothetical protein
MTSTEEKTKAETFRFEIYIGKITANGGFVKARTVGHAFLRAGRLAYKVKLFGILSERFLIVSAGNADGHYRILTKEEVQAKDQKKRTYWNVVGDGEVLREFGLLKLDFDLFGKPLFMSLCPSNAGNVLPFQLAPELTGTA